MFPEYVQSKLAYVVNDGDTLIHYFEPVRNQSNKILATNYCKI